MEQKVYNLLILDESGSMEMIKNAAVSGLNETFQTIVVAQKEHPEQKHYVTLVTFNSERINRVMDRLPVDSVAELKWNDYTSNSCTPLLDAMGLSLTELRERVTNQDVVLVTIITDGMENSSKEYNGATIKRLVAELKEQGWMFAYIGTNQDVDAVADGLGIHSKMHYEYSMKGASEMFEEERRNRKIFYNRLCCDNKDVLNEDYFSLANEEEKEQECKSDDVKIEKSNEPAPAVQKVVTTEVIPTKAHHGILQTIKYFWRK